MKSISLEENDGLRKQYYKKNYPFSKKCNKIPCNIVQAKRLYLSSSSSKLPKVIIECGISNSSGVSFSIPSISLGNGNPETNIFAVSSNNNLEELTYSIDQKIPIGNVYFNSLSHFKITLTQDANKSNVSLDQLCCAYNLKYNDNGLVGSGWIGKDPDSSPFYVKKLFSEDGYDLFTDISPVSPVKLQLTNCSEVTFNLQLAFFQKDESRPDYYVMVHTSERSNIINYNITLKLTTKS